MSADWETFAASLEAVIEAGVPLAADEHEIGRARETFLRWVGQPFGEEIPLERRNAAFLEWFVFDRPLDTTGRPPVDELLHRDAASLPPAVLGAAERLRINIVLVATVKRVAPSELVVERWANGEKLRVEVGLSAGIDRGAAFVGRVFSVDGRRYGSPAAEIIEPKRAKSLRKSLTRGRKGELEDTALYAAAMQFQLMHQRYPMAEPDQLVARWREVMSESGGG